jgi:ABC-type lipoprotein export system ATPase subunit
MYLLALLRCPPILLADKPTSNLGTASGRVVLELLLALQAAGVRHSGAGAHTRNNSAETAIRKALRPCWPEVLFTGSR